MTQQRERFDRYMNAPCSELPANDGGRDDPHRMPFQEWGVPEEFLFWLWQAAEAAALTDEQSAAIDAVCSKMTPTQVIGLGEHIHALRSIQWQARALLATNPSNSATPNETGEAE